MEKSGTFIDAVERDLVHRLEELGLSHLMERGAEGWLLKSTEAKEKPVRLNLENEFLHWKQSLRAFNSQPLYRALGIKGQHRPKVLDATCGLAGDTLQLLVYGCAVHSWERHPIPGLLLWQAYNAWQNPVKERWNLEVMEFTVPADVEIIFFDPMYSEVNKKSLPRKEMRLFREVIGQDADAPEVAQKLRSLGKRLIIKRPPLASPLLPGVSFEQSSKAVRLDVYLP